MRYQSVACDYSGQSDASLVAASDRDPRAFGELYDRHVATIYGFVRQRIEWAASDLTAETFAAAWLHRRRFRDERDGSALPWLYGIAKRVIADSVRQQQIETRARAKLSLPLDFAEDDRLLRVEQQASPRISLTHALADLTPDEREATELRIVQELPYDEVAERQGIRPAAARLRVSRALRRLATTTDPEE